MHIQICAQLVNKPTEQMEPPPAVTGSFKLADMAVAWKSSRSSFLQVSAPRRVDPRQKTKGEMKEITLVFFLFLFKDLFFVDQSEDFTELL